LKRSIALGITLLALAGCGKDTFESAPDCGGRFLVAYARFPAGDIYLFDYDGLGFHAMPNLNQTGVEESHPTISRDVRFIAFERALSLTDHDIILYDRCQAGTFAQPGLNSTGIEREPAFSGDGQKLVFVRDTLSRREVRLYDGLAHRLVPLPGIEGTASSLDATPVANQDASRIAFSRYSGGNDDIFVYDASGDSLMKLPDLATADREVDPSLTPDGRYVAFASDRLNPGSGDLDIFLYDLQSRAFVTLPAATNTTSIERHPSVNYNTDHIAFESTRPGGSGGSDVYVLSRAAGTVIFTGSSPVVDQQPWIVWQ
jgi:Tol biopolymer transport system component